MEPLIFIGIFVVIAIIGYFGRQRRKEQWRHAAQALGLTLDTGSIFSSMSLSGSYRGVPVHVTTTTRGSKNNRKTYTVYTAHLAANAPPGLAISHEGFLSGVGKFFGSQDVEVGDPHFDATFMVKAAHPDAVAQYLGRPGVTDAILELYACHDDYFRLDDGAIKFEILGADDHPAIIADRLDNLVTCVAALDGRGALEPDPMLADASRSGGGDLLQAAQSSSPAAPPPQAASPPPPAERFGPPGEPADASTPDGSGQAPAEQEDWW